MAPAQALSACAAVLSEGPSTGAPACCIVAATQLHLERMGMGASDLHMRVMLMIQAAFVMLCYLTYDVSYLVNWLSCRLVDQSND